MEKKMKGKMLVLVLSFLFLFSTISLISQEKAKKSDTTTQVQKTKEAKVTAKKSDSKLVCAVMNMPAKKNINYTYKGTKYYFCCKDCLAKFKADPEKYSKK
jgi:YHS domain-containing protein